LTAAHQETFDDGSRHSTIAARPDRAADPGRPGLALIDETNDGLLAVTALGRERLASDR
jgi:hypothetical protein